MAEDAGRFRGSGKGVFVDTGIFLWEEADGARNWAAFTCEDELKQLLSELLKRSADPAKMMLDTGTVSWMFPSLHSGRKAVWKKDILDIRNRSVVQTAAQAPAASTHEESEIGWVAPDGRFFPCGYGCHAEKAREIIGRLKPVSDPRWYLETKGWLAIYKNPMAGKSIAIGMAREYPRITDRQLQTIQRLGLEDKIENLSSYL